MQGLEMLDSRGTPWLVTFSKYFAGAGVSFGFAKP
jgi:hypothetical protein